MRSEEAGLSRIASRRAVSASAYFFWSRRDRACSNSAVRGPGSGRPAAWRPLAEVPDGPRVGVGRAATPISHLIVRLVEAAAGLRPVMLLLLFGQAFLRGQSGVGQGHHDPLTESPVPPGCSWHDFSRASRLAVQSPARYRPTPGTASSTLRRGKLDGLPRGSDGLVQLLLVDRSIPRLQWAAAYRGATAMAR